MQKATGRNETFIVSSAIPHFHVITGRNGEKKKEETKKSSEEGHSLARFDIKNTFDFLINMLGVNSKNWGCAFLL